MGNIYRREYTHHQYKKYYANTGGTGKRRVAKGEMPESSSFMAPR